MMSTPVSSCPITAANYRFWILVKIGAICLLKRKNRCMSWMGLNPQINKRGSFCRVTGDVNATTFSLVM